MNHITLVWKGIWRRPMRTTLTLFSVANAFLLFGLLQGFSSGLDTAAAGAHADVLVTSSRVNFAEPLPIAQLSQIRRISGVSVATQLVVIQGYFQRPTQAVRAYAVEPREFAEASPTLQASAASFDAMARTGTGALVSEELARRYGWKVGERIPLDAPEWSSTSGGTSWPVQVVGLYRSQGNALLANSMLINYGYLDRGRIAGRGTANVFLERIANPADADRISRAIDGLFTNSPNETKTVAESQFARDQLKQIGDIGAVVGIVVGAIFFTLLLSVGAVMMQGVRERTNEIAVLKALGFSDLVVLSIVFCEALLFCGLAAAVGLGLAAGLGYLIRSFTGFTIATGAMTVTGFVLAVVLAAATGLPPAIRALRLQPVDALAGR